MFYNNIAQMEETYVSKHNFALSFFNDILKNTQGDKYVPINDLAEFKDVDRELIIEQKNKQIFEDAHDEILKLYTKNEIRYYDRNRISHFILSFCRILCNDLGYKFARKQCQYNVVIDGKKYRKLTYNYSIIKP